MLYLCACLCAMDVCALCRNYPATLYVVLCAVWCVTRLFDKCDLSVMYCVAVWSGCCVCLFVCLCLCVLVCLICVCFA